MNLRKVAILLITSLSFATVLPAFSADFQQVEIKGPKGGSEQYSGIIYGPIDSSDTLWRIANRYRQNKNLTIYQVMLAIYQLNPTAFEEKNINLLKDGSTLRLPSERYIARINNAEALAKTQQDEVLWQSKLPADSKALINNLKPAEKLASKTDLDQTKQALEQRLGAIDEEQNRQFMAIRQQFAESINSVQTILNENQKLFERLDSVNTDLNELRSSEAQRDEQIGQMGVSINELLIKSRQEEQNKNAAEAVTADYDWLRNPITLIIVTLVISLSMLLGFAYWLIGRKKKLNSQDDLSAFASEPPPMPRSTELDDLSDALSDELSEELDNELDDVDLFGEDDSLDDILSQELEESLDDSIDGELEDFDDFGDEMLVPAESTGDLDLDSDTEIIEQEDLDRLFDEDDELLAGIDEESESIDLSDPSLEDDSIDLSDSDLDDDSIDLSDSDLDDDSIDLSGSDQDDEPIEISDVTQDDDHIEADIFENDDTQNVIEEFAEDTLLDESLDDVAQPEPALEEQNTAPANDELPAINDDQEIPEISIDELLDEQPSALSEAVDVDEPDQINEEMLQQLGKEISSQNEELDNLTGTLLDELDQVEQMRSMLPEDDEFDESLLSNESTGAPQHDIQKLDELTDVYDDELLSDEQDSDFDDISEDELIQDAETDSVSELEVEVELDPQSELDAESEIESNPESESESEPEIEAEPEFELDPESELGAKPELQSESESEPEIEAEPEFELDPESELGAKPELQSEPEPEPEIEAEPEFELDPQSELDAESEIESNPESESESEPEIEAEPEFELDPESELGAKPELQSESESEPEIEAEPEFELDPESELGAKPELQSEPEPEPEIEAEPEFELDPQSELDAESEIESNSESESESEPEIEAEIEAEPELESVQEPEPVLESQPEPEFELEPESELEAEPDTETELDKALDDFDEHPSVPPSEGLNDNEEKKNQQLDSSLDDLEFTKMQDIGADTAKPATLKPLPDLDDIGSFIDFDDAELEKALLEIESDDEQQFPHPDVRPDIENKDLADMPGLGDWLSDSDGKEDSDKVLLDELENSSFDDLLGSIEIDDGEDLEDEDDDTDLDIEALLSAESVDEAIILEETIEEDFLDVEALLTESIDAESNPLSEKNLDLDSAFGEFAGVTDDSDSVDVDGDKGVGAKLDLAQAYIEIGEIDSAKELLEEIIANGNPEQIEEAQNALTKLG